MATNSASFNRTLFLEDNLPVLRGLDSDSIDLIATDPPFNKGVPAFTGTTKAGENVEFKDVWNWNDDVHPGWTDAIGNEHPSLFNVIRYANAAAGDDMGAFLCWMAVRMLEMHRVLKPTGSIYLHCDPTASHYLKAMMDAIFGRKNFRNEIVWKYKYGGRSKSFFGRKHDIILYYTKSKSAPFYHDAVRVPHEEESLAMNFRKIDEDGRRYREGTWSSGKKYRYYADEGRACDDVWTDINALHQADKERTGYPTQKPLALYERMIKASSNPGDIVLDPFAGCATTCVAAEQLGRQWIGIDIREEAGGMIRERLEREVSANMAWDAIVRTPTTAPERTDDGEPAAPELILESSKRNARKIPVQEARRLLIERDGKRCQGCGWEPPYPDYLQVDHKKPKTLKGKDDMTNYALLCTPCNRKKSNKLTLRELQNVRVEEGRMDGKWWEKEVGLGIIRNALYSLPRNMAPANPSRPRKNSLAPISLPPSI